jgi:hypothetical protein
VCEERTIEKGNVQRKERAMMGNAVPPQRFGHSQTSASTAFWAFSDVCASGLHLLIAWVAVVIVIRMCISSLLHS